ncbi:MAG: MFS transporter [Streptosporangiaceae bacterium]
MKPGFHTPGAALGAGGDGQAAGQAGNGGGDRADSRAEGQAEGRAEDQAEGQAEVEAEDGSSVDEERRPSVREALAALRQGTTARWLVLLEVSDLLLDVLTGYVGVYMVDVAHVSPAEAAIAVAVRLGAGLAGDALFVPLSRVVSGPAVLRGTAVAAAGLYPAFLLVPSLPAKLAVLAALSVCTACWYPVIQAGLYTSLPGRSGVAVFLSSAASLLGAVGPLAVGFAAQQAGLAWALASLAAAPVAVLVLAPRERSRRVIR